jgi:mannose-6-phosphate isomerase-like protein (cupin superfamily)
VKAPPFSHPSEEDEYFFEEGCFILELANRADDPQVSIARARVPSGAETRWHRLRRTTERYVILAGEGEAFVDDRQEHVRTGDIVNIPPDTRQKIRNTGPEDLVFLAICTPRFEPVNYVDLDATESAPS